MGRRGSQCRTVADACAYLKDAPPKNDPLEYISGDLLDTFSESETGVLAALTHFTQPATVKWISDVSALAERQAETALDDLADRALLVGDPAGRTFYLPPLAAKFLQDKRPEAVTQTGDRLADRAYALALENGYDEYESFPLLEAAWPAVEAALPRLVQGENVRLQRLCVTLDTFLEYSGRWDEKFSLKPAGGGEGSMANDFVNAGWRAYAEGLIILCACKSVIKWRARNVPRLTGKKGKRGITSGRLPWSFVVRRINWKESPCRELRLLRKHLLFGAV